MFGLFASKKKKELPSDKLAGLIALQIAKTLPDEYYCKHYNPRIEIEMKDLSIIRVEWHSDPEYPSVEYLVNRKSRALEFSEESRKLIANETSALVSRSHVHLSNIKKAEAEMAAYDALDAFPD